MQLICHFSEDIVSIGYSNTKLSVHYYCTLDTKFEKSSKIMYLAIL